MNVLVRAAPRSLELSLEGRGPGAMHALEFGPRDRAIDIVFLHATGFNALTYRSLLEPLSASLRIVAIDQRGHGATTLATTPDGRRDWSVFTDDLLAALDALDSETTVLAGHSMGASVALFAAAKAPDRVRNLVLFDPVGVPPSMRSHGGDSPIARGAARRRAVFASRAAAIASYRGRGAFQTWPDAILSDYVAAGFRDLPGGEVTLACAPAWEAAIFSAQDNDTTTAFAASRCGINILQAERDSTFRRDEASQIVTGAPRIRIAVIPGSSHFLPMERPDLVQAALRAATS